MLLQEPAEKIELVLHRRAGVADAGEAMDHPLGAAIGHSRAGRLQPVRIDHAVVTKRIEFRRMDEGGRQRSEVGADQRRGVGVVRHLRR